MSYYTAFRHKGEYTPSGIGRYLGEMVLGANDGLVSILGFVAGAYGATQNNFLVFITGVIAMVAASISMGAGVFLSARAEREFYDGEKKRELFEMKELPEAETEEIRQIYKAKGFEGAELESIVKRIVSRDDLWLKTMMLEELHLIEPSSGGEWKSGLATMGAFVAAALVPLLPYLILRDTSAFWVSIMLTIMTLFAAGAVKTWVTGYLWFRAGLEMALVGGAAAGVGYFVGVLLEPFLGTKISV